MSDWKAQEIIALKRKGHDEILAEARRIVSEETMDRDGCGGRGPGEGCDMCDLYHAIMERFDRL